ncbi:MAG: AgmX/PglI C-terminal domain-containing protein [Calditrichaeota bacterium]|nr:AgmX/PglI C-terminal domain-containing protein [Calditrichota bacterium]
MKGEFATPTALPRQFHKRYFEDIDPLFLWILLISALLHFGTVGYFVINPLPQKVHQATIKMIQDQYANIVLDRDGENILIANKLVEKEPVVSQAEINKVQQRQKLMAQRRSRVSGKPAASSTPRGGTDQAGAAPGGSSGGEGEGAVSSRQQMRQQIDQQVENQGILGILSSSSAKAKSSGVGDILGSSTTASQDYNQVFNNINKLSARGGGVKGKGSGGSGTRTTARGGRTTKGGDISGAISDLGTTTTQNMTRTSGYIVSNLAPISDDGNEIDMGAVSSGARDIDEVNSIVQAHSPSIQYCYEREVRRNPDLKGKVVVRFTILPNGAVTKAKGYFQ